MTAYVSTGSSLKSTNIAGAFVEVSRLLNQAEITRNAANPALAAKNNITMSASFDGNVFTINAAIPILTSLDTSGKLVVDASDYLGSTYSAFTVGTGDAKSTDLPSAFLEISQLLAASEKSVIPTSDQPSNITIDVSLETGLATIAANIPFTPTLGAIGEVTLTAVNYV